MDGHRMSEFIEKNPWDALRRFTNARIALGRAGHALPTAPLLAFDLSHAQARDAVHHPLDVDVLHAQLRDAGFASVDVHSAAPDRQHYLRRPDLGRKLDDVSRERLAEFAAAAVAAGGAAAAAVRTGAAAGVVGAAGTAGATGTANGCLDVVFVIADGLSAFAASRHAIPLLLKLRERLIGWHMGPVVVARQARVALGDGIGELLRAKLVVMLIGERPGLSSPDSLGIYLTYEPRVGRSDAERNCISNVRPEGLSYDAAAHKLHYLLSEARRIGLTGVGLKDHSDALPGAADQSSGALAGPEDAGAGGGPARPAADSAAIRR
jgi:ethanolamine ammonia-lyase small subunit